MNTNVNRSALDAAYVRVARGRHLLKRLRALCHEVCDDYSDRLRAFYPRSLNGPSEVLALFDAKLPDQEIPPNVAILIGEVVYNFRASLDYLVGAVSRLDTPSVGIGRRNQFPIERTATGSAARRDTFLAGLNDAHVEAIEAYQPYRGCEWTALLAELSNRDKHNDLIVVLQGFDIRVEESESDGEPHHVIFSLHLTLDGDGDSRERRVLPTLRKLSVEVTKVLDAFR